MGGGVHGTELYEALVKAVEVHRAPRVATGETKKEIERDREVESA